MGNVRLGNTGKSKGNIPPGFYALPLSLFGGEDSRGQRDFSLCNIGQGSFMLQTTLEDLSEMESINGIGDGHGKGPWTSEQGPEKEFPIMGSLPVPDTE